MYTKEGDFFTLFWLLNEMLQGLDKIATNVYNGTMIYYLLGIWILSYSWKGLKYQIERYEYHKETYKTPEQIDAMVKRACPQYYDYWKQENEKEKQHGKI